MKAIRLLGALVLAVTLAGMVLSTACTGKRGPQGVQGPAGEIPVLEWHSVTSFTGSGAQNTTSFHVPMDDFRLTYFIHPTLTSASFSVFVSPADNGPMVGRIDREDIDMVSSGVEYIRDGRGDFYLKIYASDLDEWSVYVDALY